MNVLDSSALRRCTSCGVCATTCAKKAINIALDEEGFYRPAIDVSLCNDCGVCVSCCYKYDGNILMTDPNALKEKPLYASWATNDEIVGNTTSGGVGDLLTHKLYDEGYKIVGVIYNEEKTCAEHKIAHSKRDLLDFRGSKYIQSYTYDAFCEIVKNCKNEKYAVFGTPCQIYALNRFVTKRRMRSNFIFIDLYCHGCPSLFVWKKFQDEIKQKNRIGKFDTVKFRSKIRGWGAFNVEIAADGKVYSNGRYNDKFYELFFSDQLLNEACNDCQLRSTLEYTDIRLGDFWGKKFLENQRGVSAVSISTEEGKRLFDKIGNVYKEKCDYSDFLPYQSWGRSYYYNHECRKRTLNSLGNKEKKFNDAIKTLRHNQGIGIALKRVVKTLLSIFPMGFTNKIKQVIYSIR